MTGTSTALEVDSVQAQRGESASLVAGSAGSVRLRRDAAQDASFSRHSKGLHRDSLVQQGLQRESVVSAMSEMHVGGHAATRLSYRDIDLVLRRADALEHHHLAPPPDSDSESDVEGEGEHLKHEAHEHHHHRKQKPVKALARNSWVLAIMVIIISVIVVTKDRIHVPEPLAGVHATDGVEPYVMQATDGSLDYLFMNLVLGPYYPPGGDSSGGHRRLLFSTVARALIQKDAYQGSAFTGSAGSTSSVGSSGATTHGLEHAPGEFAAPASASSWEHAAARVSEGGVLQPLDVDLAGSVRRLLSRPRFTLSFRGHASGGLGGSKRRRLLVSDGMEEAANEGGDDLPHLQVSLMQPNGSDADGHPHYHVVSASQYCTTKEDAAVKCQMAFTPSDLTDAYDSGLPLYLGFEATKQTQLVFKVEVADVGYLGPAKDWIALGILGVVLVGIASEKVHRMWCAFIGAAFMMALLLWMNMAPPLALVVEWIDESTLGLLFGMMIIVGRLKDTGLFELLSATTVRMSKGRMWVLSVLLMVVTAVLSAFLDNVTTMLLMAPVSISLMRQCNRQPIPLLMAQALMSNIGGAATMVGDPPALIIGTALSKYIGFVDFIINMAPGVLLASIFCVPLILLIYRKTLLGRIEGYDAVLEEVKGFRIVDWDLFAKCIFVTGMVLVGFLLHPVHHVDPAWFAVLGAVVLCVADQPGEVEHVIHSVEWDMLLFFAGMFIMIEAGAEIGMINRIAGWLEAGIRAAPEESRTIIAIQILLWVSAFVSAMLDNIPYTITMVPVIEYLASAGLGLELPTLAWALNFGACFGGNGSLIGASANIVTATLSERAGEKISFFGWMKSGVPVMIVSVAMADVWMILRFCL